MVLAQWLRLLTLIPADGVQVLTKAAVFSVFLSKSLSLCSMCSDQHVKYPMPHGFPLASSLLLDYHVKQYIYTPLGPVEGNCFSFVAIIAISLSQ